MSFTPLHHIQEYDKLVLKSKESGTLNLFLEAWLKSGHTFKGVVELIELFEIPNMASTEKKLIFEYGEQGVDDAYDDTLKFIIPRYITPLNVESVVCRVGGAYSTDWDGDNFGLTFTATPEENIDIQKQRKDLLKMLNTEVSTNPPERISYRNATYKLAYYLPKKMDGVRLCKREDKTDRRSKDLQIWCVFSKHGRLMGRFPEKKAALRYKVFLINRYWLGPGKHSKNKPSNK